MKMFGYCNKGSIAIITIDDSDAVRLYGCYDASVTPGILKPGNALSATKHAKPLSDFHISPPLGIALGCAIEQALEDARRK